MEKVQRTITNLQRSTLGDVLSFATSYFWFFCGSMSDTNYSGNFCWEETGFLRAQLYYCLGLSCRLQEWKFRMKKLMLYLGDILYVKASLRWPHKWSERNVHWAGKMEINWTVRIQRYVLLAYKMRGCFWEPGEGCLHVPWGSGTSLLTHIILQLFPHSGQHQSEKAINYSHSRKDHFSSLWNC